MFHRRMLLGATRPPFVAAGGGGGGAAYVYKGSTAGLSSTLDIGTASSDRFVIVGVSGESIGATYGTTATVAGVTLNRDAFYNQSGAGRAVLFYSGLVTSGNGSQSIVITRTGETGSHLHIWTVTGNASIAFRQTASNSSGGAPSSISVTGGDFMFGVSSVGGASPNTWTSSTQASFADHPDSAFGGFGGSDWTIASTNASFSAQPDAGFAWLVATYH
jgi:hypothetical protein